MSNGKFSIEEFNIPFGINVEESINLFNKLSREMSDFVETFSDTLKSNEFKHFKNCRSYGIKEYPKYYRGYGKDNLRTAEIPITYLTIKKNSIHGCLSEKSMILTTEAINELFKYNLDSYLPENVYDELSINYTDDIDYIYKIKMKKSTFTHLQVDYEDGEFKDLSELNEGVNLFLEMVTLTNSDSKELKDYLLLLKYLYNSNDSISFELAQGLYNQPVIATGIIIDIENGNNFNDEIKRLKDVLEVNGFKMDSINHRYGYRQ